MICPIVPLLQPDYFPRKMWISGSFFSFMKIFTTDPVQSSSTKKYDQGQKYVRFSNASNPFESPDRPGGNWEPRQIFGESRGSYDHTYITAACAVFPVLSVICLPVCCTRSMLVTLSSNGVNCGVN